MLNFILSPDGDSVEDLRAASGGGGIVDPGGGGLDAAEEARRRRKKQRKRIESIVPETASEIKTFQALLFQSAAGNICTGGKCLSKRLPPTYLKPSSPMMLWLTRSRSSSRPNSGVKMRKKSQL